MIPASPTIISSMAIPLSPTRPILRPISPSVQEERNVAIIQKQSLLRTNIYLILKFLEKKELSNNKCYYLVDNNLTKESVSFECADKFSLLSLGGKIGVSTSLNDVIDIKILLICFNYAFE